MLKRIILNKAHLKKFKVLLNLNDSELFFSVNSLSSVMSQSRILEPELLDDYFLDLFNNLYLDLVADKNFLLNGIDFKLPLFIYFFKKDKNLVYIKSVVINFLLDKHFNRISRKFINWSFRMKFFYLNLYSSIDKIKSVAFINKKKQPIESETNMKYFLTCSENFKLLVLKSMVFLFDLVSYNFLLNNLEKTRNLFISHVDKLFMKRRKINFRRKNKK